MADDFAAVATAAGIDRVHVVGLSMGGMVTAALAVRHAEHVASVVFLSAMSPDTQAGMGPRFFDGIGADPVVGTLASMGAASDDDERWMRARVATAQARAAPRPDAARRHQQAALRLGWPTPEDLAAIDAPTLVVHGGVDLVLPVAHAHALADGIPNARLHEVDGMGHLPTRREWIVLADLVARHVTAAHVAR
jgi:pimeloyl-ACP methyl ester carboxylesterase